MARIRGGGFALDLRGAVGPVALQRHRGGTLSAHPRTLPANPNTAGQISVRQVYRWLAAYASLVQGLTDSPIAIYAKWKATTVLAPLVADNVKLLKGVGGISPFIPHRVSFGVPSFSSITTTASVGSIAVTVGRASSANGYATQAHIFVCLLDQDSHGVFVPDLQVASPGVLHLNHTFSGLTSGAPYLVWAYPLGLNPKGKLGAGAPLTATAFAG